MRLLILFILSLYAAMSVAADEATVSLNRSWGLLLGDNFTVVADLPVETSDLDQTTLPAVDKRYGNWLFLKKIDLDKQRMLLHYQVINVATHNVQIETPPLSVNTVKGDTVTIPSLSLTIGPLLADKQDGNATFEPKPDHPAQVLAVGHIKQQFYLAVVIAVAALLMLIVWHLGWKPRNRAPFAQAVFELTKMKWLRQHDIDAAARVLHAAFNGTAGTIVVYSELEPTLGQVAWLQNLQQDIEAFYAASTQRFFSRQGPQALEFDAIVKLAKACRAREKVA